MVNFGFHPALKVTKITDDAGKLLDGERTADGAIRVTAGTRHSSHGQTAHWTFVYDGIITGNEDGPVEGLKLAAIQEPISLSALRGALVSHHRLHDRPLHRRNAHPRSPGHACLRQRCHGASKSANIVRRQARRRIRLQLDQARISRHRDRRPLRRPGFGRRRQRQGLPHRQPPGLGQPARADGHQGIRLLYRQLRSGRRRATSTCSKLPDDTLPAVWAPELAAIMGARVGDKIGVRLLANTIAHQWWGCEVSPRTLNDAWITNGMSRYGELMYVEEDSGKSALRSALARCRRRRSCLRHHSPARASDASIPSRLSSSP